MTMDQGGEFYRRLGLKRVINGASWLTMLGGSIMPPPVVKAMEDASRWFVDLYELNRKAGEVIARFTGAEAGMVTAGAASGMLLEAAACMTGTDPAKVHKLPDTTGMKNEIIIQKKQRYSYDRSYTVTGGKLVEAGDESGCTPEQLEAAIGPRTAAIAYFVQPDWGDSVVSLEDTVKIAHGHGLPVIADAASQIYPLDYFRRNAQSADLVCFGAKYIGAPHATGFVVGKKDLVDTVMAHGFIGFHTGGRRAIGRPMKVDRQGVVAVCVALKGWFSTNHEDRLLAVDSRLATMQRDLQGIPHVQPRVVQLQRYWGSSLHVILDTQRLGKTAEQVSKELADGSPRIWVNTQGEGTVVVNAHTLKEGEEKIVARRLREVLTAKK